MRIRPLFVSTALSAALLGLLGLPRAVHADPATLGVFLSRPQSQTTIYDLTTVETFESLATGNRTTDFSSAIGTYHLSNSNPFNIQSDNQYGTGTGQYMAIGAQASSSAPITLTFNTPQSYFGFSWNAGDGLNGLTFYNGATTLGHFYTSTLTDLLQNSTVRAIDGTDYLSSQYKGKPGTGQNSNEPYAFVNFIATNQTFDSVVFDNSGSTGSGFESDNHTIRTDTPTLDQTSVFAASVSPSGTTPASAAPEPATLALALPFLPLAAGLALRRRKQRAAASVPAK